MVAEKQPRLVEGSLWLCSSLSSQELQCWSELLVCNVGVSFAIFVVTPVEYCTHRIMYADCTRPTEDRSVIHALEFDQAMTQIQVATC